MVSMNKISLLLQIGRFSVVGISAAIVHFCGLVFLVEMDLLPPLYANVIAFFIAFQVSYWGHRMWTFAGTVAQHRTALPKLLVVATTGLAVNQGLFYIFLTVFELQYMVALFIVLAIVPVMTFTVSRRWVF